MNGINELLEKNKYEYQRAYEKSCELNKSTQDDFNNLLNITNQIPSTLSDSDKNELAKILGTIEVRVRHYENEIDNIEAQTNLIERTTNAFINSLGHVKGGALSQKNNLMQSSIEQINVLREGLGLNKEIIIRLEKLLSDLKNIQNLGSGNQEQFRNEIRSVIREELESIKGSVTNCQKHSEMNEHVTSINSKCRDSEMKIEKLEAFIRETLENLESRVEAITESVQEAHEKVAYGLKQNKNYGVDFIGELNDIKIEVASKLRQIEGGLNNSHIKRYI